MDRRRFLVLAGLSPAISILKLEKPDFHGKAEPEIRNFPSWGPGLDLSTGIYLNAVWAGQFDGIRIKGFSEKIDMRNHDDLDNRMLVGATGVYFRCPYSTRLFKLTNELYDKKTQPINVKIVYEERLQNFTGHISCLGYQLPDEAYGKSIEIKMGMEPITIDFCIEPISHIFQEDRPKYHFKSIRDWRIL